MLTVSNLQVFYSHDIPAVNSVSFSLDRGETICLIGESGCGKSSILYALLQLSQGQVQGSVSFRGRELTQLPATELRALRGKEIALIAQEVRASLNPVRTIGGSLCDILRAHQRLSRADAKARALSLLRTVGLPSPETLYSSYPHQLSGGMCQRVLIACALANEPQLLLADEPTASLDATVRAQIVRLLQGIRAERCLSMLIATHDFAVVRALADRILVMYAGELVEVGSAQEILSTPTHPYTRMLLACENPLTTQIPAGEPPSPTAYPAGCRFHPRCDNCAARCQREAPLLQDIGGGHLVRCPQAYLEKENSQWN